MVIINNKYYANVIVTFAGVVVRGLEGGSGDEGTADVAPSVDGGAD